MQQSGLPKELMYSKRNNQENLRFKNGSSFNISQTQSLQTSHLYDELIIKNVPINLSGTVFYE